jgi:DegV family protein with EDD domain
LAARIAIVTDSTADIPADLAQERQIYTIPMQIIWGKETLRDGIDISSEEFYQRLASATDLPTTSHPPLNDFVQVYNRARDETGAEAVLLLTISSRLSGTFNAGRQAAKMTGFAVHVVDTRTGSMAHGLTALALADARDEGISPTEAVKLAPQIAARTKMIFALDTLEFLWRSGRVSHLKWLIASALRIKPILHVKDGGLALLEQVRTRKRMLERLLEIFVEVVDRSRPLRVGVLHGNAPAEMQALLAAIQTRFSPALLIQNTVCAPVGVHTGPGSLGFAILQ